MSNHDNINGGYECGVLNNKVEFGITSTDNAAVVSRNVARGTVLALGVRYDLAGVYAQSNYIRTYVNGIFDRELTTSELLGSSTGTFIIGRYPGHSQSITAITDATVDALHES
jgi:hypothetical protein